MCDPKNKLARKPALTFYFTASTPINFIEPRINNPPKGGYRFARLAALSLTHRMEESRPSRTALRVALRRAAHQIYDPPPHVLEDPIAVPILGPEYAPDLHKTATKLHKPFSAALRAFLVARSRYAEDQLAAAVADGVTQYVLLGAGLDTFAYRNPHPSLRGLEVDPIPGATQQWLPISSKRTPSPSPQP